MVATLGVAQGKNGLTTLEESLINCNYQLLWPKIVVNREMQLKKRHPGMFQSLTVVVRKKNDNKLGSK